jgi:Flp pilus assembly protein TadB
VPLSDHEQRLLEQIEQALYAEDPKFARLYRSADVHSHYRRRLLRALAGLVIGLGLLLTGVILPLIALGVAGFVVMLIAVSYGVAQWQRMTGHRLAAQGEQTPRRKERAPKPPRGSLQSMLKRLEERWERRQDDNGR